MDVTMFIVLIVSMQFKLASSVTTSISGVISEDIIFLHKTFPVSPSMRAIIEVDAAFPDIFIKQQGNCPAIGIYTTDNHTNIKKRCTYLDYGQLANGNLHPNIRNDEGRDLTIRCVSDDGNTHCIGKIMVKDFKPRHFSFSLGFLCKDINALSSLKGLVYNISIHEQTNDTNCIWVPYNSARECHQYFRHTALPNLIGGENVKTVSKDYETVKSYILLLYMIGLCYQHLQELACYVLVPKCDPVSRQVIHPCREMCYDLRTACSKITLPKDTILRDKLPHVPSGENIVVDIPYTEVDCDYLPSLNGDIPCHYKPVTCKSPPAVKHSTMLNTSMNYNNYSVLDTVDYSCNEGFQMVGNKNISCMYSGEWSTPPKCSVPSKSTTPLVVVLPVLFFPLLILFSTLILRNRFKFRTKLQPDLKMYHQVDLDTILMEIKGTDRPLLPLKRQFDLKRNNFFDAFVLYHFESNDSFVVDHLIPELEEQRKFKLLIHSRNFTPGRDIKDNIEEAIENSNSAIIVMSQGFVDSMWCKEEFTHCYIENMKDAAFNLLVIMMQPVETLVNVSPYMKSFIANKTYLDVNDPELFPRLARQLKNARLLEVDDVDDADGNEDSDDD